MSADSSLFIVRVDVGVGVSLPTDPLRFGSVGHGRNLDHL